MVPFSPGTLVSPLGPGNPFPPSQPSLPLSISRLGDVAVLLFTKLCLVVMLLLKASLVN